MSPVLVGIIGFIILFALLALGLPIGASMVLVGIAGFGYLVSFEAAITKAAYITFDSVASYHFAVLPLFMFMAEIVFRTGLNKDLYTLAARWLGHFRGGLGMATVGGCAVMAAVASSSLATAAPMAMVAMPEMKRHKYDPALAAGCVTAGGTMGILIPPSGGLIIYGILTEQSIAKLFAGGMIPGILEALFYCITIFIMCTIKPALGPKGPKFPLRDKLAAFTGTWEMIGLVLFCLGGLFLGWFTPTEAGAAGAFGAIFFSMLRRRLTWQLFKEATFGTMKLAGMIYAVLIGAGVFKYFMAVTTIPFWLADVISGLPVSPTAIMAAIIVMYFIMGCFLDTLAMILLTIPIFFPISESLGFSPIWFGIILMRVMEVGQISPPFGIIVFSISKIVDIPIITLFKGVIPFIIADVLNIALLLFIPGIVTFFPNLIV